MYGGVSFIQFSGELEYKHIIQKSLSKASSESMKIGVVVSDVIAA